MAIVNTQIILLLIILDISFLGKHLNLKLREEGVNMFEEFKKLR
jgi:hypothetical protein